MTNGELWVAVGHELRRRRVSAGYSSTIALASAIGDPHAQKTFDRLERGEVGQIKSVHRYCEAIQTSLPEVLRALLPAADLSGRAVQVASAYDRLPEIQRLVDLALQIPLRAEPPVPSQAEQVRAPRAADAAKRARWKTARHHR